MSSLLIRIKKQRDGTAALSCTRADGSVMWQRQEGTSAAFFPLHDLTHYAVETVLGFRSAFYGLVADGWDLTDFGKPWPRGSLPEEAGLAEVLVGFLDTERASGTRWTAEEVAEQAASYFRDRGVAVQLDIADAQLAEIRKRRAELFAQWGAVVAGEALELWFESVGA